MRLIAFTTHSEDISLASKGIANHVALRLKLQVEFPIRTKVSACMLCAENLAKHILAGSLHLLEM